MGGIAAVAGAGVSPDHCPACHERIEARPLVAHSTSPDDLLVDFAFQCPQVHCRRLFVAEYALEAGDGYDLMAVAAPAFDEHALAGFR